MVFNKLTEVKIKKAARFWVAGLLVMSLLLSMPARANPRPRPRPARRGTARHRAARPAAHWRRPVQPVRRRYARGKRYWHPGYHSVYDKRVWNRLGYQYYIGGTSYVTVVPEESAIAESSQALQVAAETVAYQDASAKRLEQIQELIILVYEWRTLNESPEIHNRLGASDKQQDVSIIVENIQAANGRFDNMTREAMGQLAEGKSALKEIEMSRAYLERLVELVESLPGPQDKVTEDKQPESAQ